MPEVIYNKQIATTKWSFRLDMDIAAAQQESPVLDYLLLSLAEFKKNRNIVPHTAPVIDGSCVLVDVVEQLLPQKVIGLNFPLFKDGRCYTHAKLLRQRYKYQGDIHAVGDIHLDQLCFMARCGINVFHLENNIQLPLALKYFDDIDVVYQQV